MIIGSIMLHEFGHLITALWFKVKVTAYSIGFGKVLLHKKWKKIDWRISLIPLGGYCELEERIGEPHSLAELSYSKQLIIILAGILMNLLIATICYWIQFRSFFMGFYFDLQIWKLLLTNNYDSISYLVYHLDLNPYILQCSILNIGLFITNLLPIPALDGGYIWLLPLQKKLSPITYKRIIYFGILFLIISQVWLIYYWWLR